MKSQKGSAHAIILVILVAALLGLLSFIFWQNFIHEEPASTKTVEKVKTTKDKVSKKVSTPENLKAPVTEAALSQALPEGCSLGINVEPFGFDANKLTVVDSSSPALGAPHGGEYGRINADKTWTYLAGGCGSNAGAFVLNANDGDWKLVAYHVGDALFVCSKVDGLGIPLEVAGRCFDPDNSYEERNILP